MKTIYECEVLEAIDMGWCPICETYREIFIALVPQPTRPDMQVEACARCLRDIAELAETHRRMILR